MQRLKDLTPFIVMDIVKEAAKYNDVIHFEIGQPDLLPSLKVKEALLKATQENRFAYTQTEGLEILREKIAAHYKKVYNIKIDSKNIILTPGTSGAFLLAYSLVLDYKKVLGFSDPGYPSYKNFSYILDINPLFINVDKNSNFCITKDHLKNKKLEALQISNPSNPTGNIYEKESLKELIKYCEEKNIAFISDELYHGLTYESKVHSALEFSENVIVINGFSKYFCMPGFRLGWIIVPNKYLRKAIIMAQNLFISPPTLSQYAAIEAFDYEYLENVNKIFKKRRDFLYENLKDIFKIPIKPQGAFYIWADISKYSNNAFLFSKKLLKDIQVALTPGVDFGKNNTENFVRFSYTTDIKNLKTGVERLKSYLL